MSIKVLIVDDERLERALIKMSYNWEENGFEVIGEAASGVEAMHFVNTFKPNIIFTDINMPFINGLEFTTWVNDQIPTAKVIMITGYEKFEYAKKAIQLGVKDFLLKPIQKEDIRSILETCKEEIEREKENESVMTELKEMKQQLISQQVLGRLVENTLNYELECEKIADSQLAFLLQGGRCLNIKVDDESKVDAVMALLKCTQLKEIPHVMFRHYSGNIICITGQDEIKHILDEIELRLRIEIKNDFLMSVGQYESSLQGSANSYRQSVIAMTEAMYVKAKEVIYFEELKSSSKQQVQDMDFKELRFFLENGLDDKVNEFIDQYMSLLVNKNILEMDMIKLVLMNIVSIILNYANEKGYTLASVFESEHYFYDCLAKSNSLQEIGDFLKIGAKKIMRHRLSLQEKPGNKLIETSKAYILENLYDSQLSLKTMAAYLYVNESYLSRTFKKEEGISVIEYITHHRIQKSIELLTQTDLKAYEVAEKIGINDPHYFGICFKKYTGKTIKQFKSQLIK